MKNKKFTTKRIVIDALFAAMVLLLSYLSITIGGLVKVSLESLPVVVGALMFGPWDGVMIGMVGSFLYQILGPYGITPTLPLWMLPYIAEGLVVGYYAREWHLMNSKKQLMRISIAGEVIAFAFNTLALFIDSKMYGYYTPVSIWGMAGIRLLIAIARAVMYGLILPPLLHALAKVTGRRR